MTIKLEFSSLDEMKAFARDIVAEESGKKPVKAEVPTKTVITGQPEEIQTEEDPVNDEQPPEDEATPTYTLEEVRAKLTALTRAGKQKEVRDILDHFKAKNVTALDPKDYAGVMEKAGAI